MSKTEFIINTIVGTLIIAFLALSVFFLFGCSYKGGKVVDGTNLEVGMTVPGTEWSINFLSYTGGAIVKGNDMTCIEAQHDVDETNSYFFGVVETRRSSGLNVNITPCEGAATPAK